MIYVELHARSAFSFLEGVSVPEELMGAASDLEMPAMALLDRDGVYGAPRFHLAAQKKGLKAHVGAEITVKVRCPMSNVQCQKPKDQGGKTDLGPRTLNLGQRSTFSIPILVRNRTGYQNLCRLISLMKLRVPKHAKPGECAVTPEELAAHAEGLICLTGADDGPLANGGSQRGSDWERQQRNAEWLLEVFGNGNVYAELQRHFNRNEESRNQAVVAVAEKLQLPLLATNGVCQATPAQREVADVFTCLRNHVRLENAGRLLARNSEAYLKSASGTAPAAGASACASTGPARPGRGPGRRR